MPRLAAALMSAVPASGVLHVDSDRPSRAYVLDATRQTQTMVQTALKVAF